MMATLDRSLGNTEKLSLGAELSFNDTTEHVTLITLTGQGLDNKAKQHTVSGLVI